MKTFTKLFVVIVAFFSMSTLSAQIITPTVDLDLNDLNVGANVGVELDVDQGSTTVVPVVLNDALGLVLGLISDVNVTVEGSPNFQITDVKKGILGLNLLSFKLKYVANGPSGTEETANIKINITTPLRSTVQATTVARMRIR